MNHCIVKTEWIMKKTMRIVTCFVCLCGLVSCNTVGQPASGTDMRSSPHGDGLQPDMYGIWPTEDFTTSTPESQGVDSNAVLKRLEKVVQKKVQPDSFLVLRNGYLINETYFHGYDKDTAHSLYSVTKSVLSALVGIAIEEGYIAGADQKVQDFFPGVSITENLQYKKDMTIQHLLTMTSGIWGEAAWDELTATENVGDALFALPQQKMPGEEFHYDTVAARLLGIVVSRATGKPLYEYAKEKLFDPLGMDSVRWIADEEGNYYGDDGISMTPRDMLRFGYLYLNYGRWEDKQIIPGDWIAQSLPQMEKSGDYGRLFWANQHNPKDGYEASGAYGQYITVFPELDMVVVVTNNGNQNQKYLYEDIRKGVQNEPMQENPQVQEQIAQLSNQVSPVLPHFTDLQKQFTVKKTHDIDLATLIVSKNNNAKLSYSQTELGWHLEGDNLSSRIETQETFRFPLIVTIQYIPEENSNFMLVFRKGEFGLDHNNHKQSTLWVCDFMKGWYSDYAPKASLPAGEAVTVQWILHSNFQVITENEELMLFSPDSPYMHMSSFSKRRKAPVQLAAEFGGVTIQSITISELY